MAILEMDKLHIYGLSEQRKNVLEFLHKSESVEIADAHAEDYGLGRKETAKSISGFNGYIADASKALEILAEYVPEKKALFEKRIQSDESHYSMDSEEINRVNKHIYDILRAYKTIKTNEDSISKISIKQMQITPYMKLDVPMNYHGTKTVKAKLGSVDGELDGDSITSLAKEAGFDDIYFEILSSSKQQTCLWFLYPAEKENEVNTFLRSIGFIEPSFSLSHRTTKKKYEKLQEDKEKILRDNEKLKQEIISFGEYRKEIELFYDHLVMRREKYEALSHAAVTENTFIIAAYVPERASKKLTEQLEQMPGVVTELEKCPRDEAPAAFSNNAFAAPVEGITSDYAMPSADDIDPNPIMAVSTPVDSILL